MLRHPDFTLPRAAKLQNDFQRGWAAIELYAAWSWEGLLGVTKCCSPCALCSRLAQLSSPVPKVGSPAAAEHRCMDKAGPPGVAEGGYAGVG